jgi:hypothetical protein
MQRLLAMPGSDRIYLFSFCLLISMVGLRVFSPAWAPWLLEALSVAGLAGCGFAFILFWTPKLKSIVAKPYMKYLSAVLHAIFFALAAALASNAVANAIGFPPHDFGFTLSLCTLLFYPLVWLLSITLVLGVSALIFQILGILKMMARRKFGNEFASFRHMFGALGVILLLGFATEYVLPSEKSVSAGIKLFAYFSDYQILPGYPGLPKGERIRLHENGVFSMAKLYEKGQVVISHGTYVPQ